MLRLSPLALVVLTVPVIAQDQPFKGQLPIVPGTEAAVPTEKTFLFEMQADGKVRHADRSLSADQLHSDYDFYIRHFDIPVEG